MAAVPCPCCEETVRLPMTEMPAEAVVQCPWCQELRPATQWLSQLPPLAAVFAADGSPLPQRPDAEQSNPGQSNAGQSNPGQPDDNPRGNPNGAAPQLPPATAPAAAGDSVPAANQESFPGEDATQQWSLEEIERAWDANQANWEADEDIAASPSGEPDLAAPNGASSEGDVETFPIEPRALTDDSVDDDLAQTHRPASESSPSSPAAPQTPRAIAAEADPIVEHHPWRRRRTSPLTWLKIAAPSLAAIPIIAALIHYSSPSLGLLATNLNDAASISPADAARASREAGAGPAGAPSESTAASASAARTEPSLLREEPSDEAPKAMSSLDQAAVAPAPAAVGGTLASSDLPGAPDPRDVPPTAVAEQVPAESRRTEDTTAASQPKLPERSQDEPVDELLQDLREAALLVEDVLGEEDDPSDAAQPTPTRMTAEVRARQRLAEQAEAAPSAARRSASDSERSAAGGGLMIFPGKPPSAESIQPSGAASGAVPREQASNSQSAVSWSPPDLENLPPQRPLSEPWPLDDVPTSQRSEREADSRPAKNSIPSREPQVAKGLDQAEPQPPGIATAPAAKSAKESPLKLPPGPPASPPSAAASSQPASRTGQAAEGRPEAALRAACVRARDALAKLPPTAPAAAAGDDASDHVQARLIAYRELARLADVEPTPSHPAIIELLQRVVEEPVRSQLAPLCRDWVDWGKRDTDGVLLVGQIIPGGHGGHGERIELQGGDRLPIQITGELVLASDQDYVALGQIITGAETFHIHIIAAVAAP